jgi:hypothetical protein
MREELLGGFQRERCVETDCLFEIIETDVDHSFIAG